MNGLKQANDEKTDSQSASSPNSRVGSRNGVGHNSEAVDRAYAKHAAVNVQSLDDW
jgi:hypothetical protein